jgi:lysophospholipase L1-like esterase
VVAQRREVGDANIHSLHGHELFGVADVDDLPDGLHPNSAGYRRMGQRFTAFAFGPDGPFA